MSVGLTSKNKKGKNATGTNYACSNDILGNGKQSYLRRRGVVSPRKNYFGNFKGFMIPEDYAKAKLYAKKAKFDYLNKKK